MGKSSPLQGFNRGGTIIIDWSIIFIQEEIITVSLTIVTLPSIIKWALQGDLNSQCWFALPTEIESESVTICK